MTDAMKEQIAQVIYTRGMLYLRTTLPEWTPGGNSLAQDEARSVAQAILEALPSMVPPLVWEHFGERAAKATAWGKANYLITKWSDGRFELIESYPGYQGDNLAGGFCDTLEAAKAAANAHHVAQLMRALGLDAAEREGE